MTRAVVLAAAGALVLTSCNSGGGNADDEVSPSGSPSPSTTVAIPEGVSLTEPGAEVSFGDTARVAFEPSQTRGSVLELTVKKTIKGSVRDFSSFILDDKTKTATPYYVLVSVKNVGEGDLGGASIPLWGVDADNTLLPPASFTTGFSRCPSEPLPDKFPAGATVDSCLVYLAPDRGVLEGVSYRPTEEFSPIQWTGEITTPKPEPKPEPKKKQPAKKKQRK